jgi:hypothetical protein
MERHVSLADGQVYLRAFDSGQFDADSNALFTSIGIDCRLPWRRSQLGKAGPGLL